MLCISVSHKLAPVEIRQRYAFSKQEIECYIKSLNIPCVVLSTCNRVEIYYGCGIEKLDYVEKSLSDFKKLDYNKKYISLFEGRGAILHLYKVACGLESAIVGEDEILRQIKDAYYMAMEYIDTGLELNTLFKGAITCAKKIKTDTLISKTAVSIGTLVASFVSEHKAKNVLIIGGSGYTGGIVMKNILSAGGVEISATVRRHNSVTSCFDENIKIVPFEDRYTAVNNADIIISATTSPHYTITYDELKKTYIQDRKRIFIDLAVPRDIDKAITELENTELFDIDYFKTIKEKNTKLKLREIDRAAILAEQLADEAEKELYFHSVLPQLNELAMGIEYNGAKRLIYAVRDEFSYDEFKHFIDVLQKLKR